MIKRDIEEDNSCYKLVSYLVLILWKNKNLWDLGHSVWVLKLQKIILEFFSYGNGYYVTLCNYAFREEGRKNTSVILPAHHNHVNQFNSVTQSCPAVCDPMDCSMPGFLVHHQLLELTQTHVNRVGDDIQPSHPLLSPFPPTFDFSQHQGLFQWVSSLQQVAKVLEFQLQHQTLQWIFRTDFL